MERGEVKRPVHEPQVGPGGPPCAESQADGVPCDELGRDCEDCERAEAAAEERESVDL